MCCDIDGLTVQVDIFLFHPSGIGLYFYGSSRMQTLQSHEQQFSWRSSKENGRLRTLQINGYPNRICEYIMCLNCTVCTIWMSKRQVSLTLLMHSSVYRKVRFCCCSLVTFVVFSIFLLLLLDHVNTRMQESFQLFDFDGVYRFKVMCSIMQLNPIHALGFHLHYYLHYIDLHYFLQKLKHTNSLL